MEGFINSKRILIVLLSALFILTAISLIFDNAVYANTGEIKWRHYNDPSWSSFGGTSVPLPGGFSPLTYGVGYDNRVYIINPGTGEIKWRHYNDPSWSSFPGTSVPLPGGFSPLTYGVGYDNRVYIIETSQSPIISTQNATNITSTTVTANGTLSSLGFPTATQYGFQWGPSSNPYQNQTSCGMPTATGSFTLNLTNLTEATLYYVRAYATSALGTTYGNQISFTTHELPHISIDPSSQNQSLSELEGNNSLIISGTLNDPNVGCIATIKYTIEDFSNHTDISLSPTITASGSSQPFNYQVPINNSIPEGVYILDIWAVDNYGQSAVTKLNFTVDKSAIGSDGEPILRVVTIEGKAFNEDANTGSYTDISSTFLVNNTGIGKPFFDRNYSYRLNGTTVEFYDCGSAITYIGNNTFRVVTSGGKTYDVEKDSGTYIDISESFLNNNIGSGKPFYDRIYEQEFNGYGPFIFSDFGSTMAYIGNNKIRVVTSERKAFDVDKDTGEYVEVNNFLDNNWGSGKPFYLREYTHTIGGKAKTFYDWGSSMTYIGNNTLRVVTSEGKAFDVDKDTGVYTDITSTFLINNFGEGKPFYLRTYPVTINGTSYDFYDWGSTFAYTDTDCPAITITTPREQAAFETITLSGTVSDKSGGAITVSAAITGVTKTATITNTTTPQDWSLEWDIAADNIPDGSYTDIAVQAENEEEEFSAVTYTGTIAVYGTGSNVTRETVHYVYDDNGKLVRRRIVATP